MKNSVIITLSSDKFYIQTKQIAECYQRTITNKKKLNDHQVQHYIKYFLSSLGSSRICHISTCMDSCIDIELQSTQYTTLQVGKQWNVMCGYHTI